MLPKRNVGGRDRLARALLAVVLTAVAVRSLGRGRKTAGLLASVAAAGLAFNAVACFCGLNELLGVDTTSD
jgi:4-amino-4-deoxy-L-arabinose transferase-like glycosyltransferase